MLRLRWRCIAELRTATTDLRLNTLTADFETRRSNSRLWTATTKQRADFETRRSNGTLRAAMTEQRLTMLTAFTTEKETAKKRKKIRSTRGCYFSLGSELENQRIRTRPFGQPRDFRRCSQTKSSLVITSHPGKGSSAAARGCIEQTGVWPHQTGCACCTRAGGVTIG